MADGKTVAAVREIALPIAESLGLTLWDIEFVKEGAMYYLRIYIDRAEGVRIQDCEAMSKAMDEPLDAADPIEQSYCLEVSSPGLERKLSRPEHFEAMQGRKVLVKLYQPVDGKKEITAVLTGLRDGVISLEPDITIEQKAAASVRLLFEG